VLVPPVLLLLPPPYSACRMEEDALFDDADDVKSDA